jgi:hypothetical protein
MSRNCGQCGDRCEAGGGPLCAACEASYARARQAPEPAAVAGAVGETIWALCGPDGWRAGTVVPPGLTRTRVAVAFDDGSLGRRRLENLRPRNPLLRGRDRPER